MAGLLTRITGAKAGEGRALVWSFAYFFFVLATYYTLRPVREEMAVRSGVGSLPWLYTGTFVSSLVIAPIFAFLVARLRRMVFIPVVYGFLLANVVVFWTLLTQGVLLSITATVFFVWINVFSVFAVSVFWSFMADLFTEEQAKRLYPVIAAGGALGAVAGSSSVNWTVHAIGATNLLLVAGVFLGLAIFCALSLGNSAAARARKVDAVKVGGGVLDGFLTILRSPYLMGIAVWVFLISLSNTLGYSVQTELVGKAHLDPETRTQLFSRIDLTANILIPLLQLTVTRFLLNRMGIAVTLSLVACTFLAAFIGLALWPVLPMIIGYQIATRTAQYGLSNPAREALWPVVALEEKYKAKNVVDNAVFRGSDVANAWLFRVLHLGLGLPVNLIATIGAPLMAGWVFLSFILGHHAKRRAQALPQGGNP